MGAGVYSRWIERSLAQLAELMPGRYAKFEESSGWIAAIDRYAYRAPNGPAALGEGGESGEPMDAADWSNDEQPWIGKLLRLPDGEALLMLLNASARNISCRLPASAGRHWMTLLDTANRDFTGGHTPHKPGDHVLLRQRSLRLFHAVTKED